MAIKPLKYAGIGPRDLPQEAVQLLSHVGSELLREGWLLRSGNAQGADQAWAQQVTSDMREIYLPWDGFNCVGRPMGFHVSPMTAQLEAVASVAHRGWLGLTQGRRKLMMRNVSIILGPQLDDHVEFVAYWHAKTQPDGGTGNAVRLAQANGIHCFNIKFERDQQAMVDWVESYNKLD